MSEYMYSAIDMMLAELLEPIFVYFATECGSWVYRIQVTSERSLVIHGTVGYNKERAYEDALRYVLGLSNLEDQKLL